MGFNIDSGAKELLAKKTKKSTAGGGLTNMRIAFKDDLEVIPRNDPNFPGTILDSYVFKATKGFIILSTNIRKSTVEEAADETFGLSAMDSTFTGEIDADEEVIRNLVNDGLNQADVYILVDHCRDGITYSFGNGSCCPAMIKIGAKTGAESKDGKTFPVKVMVQDGGLVPLYKGIGSMAMQVVVAPDTTTINVATGPGTYLLPENTEATAIVAMTNAVVGNVYTLSWNSTTEHSTISDGAVFHLTSAFTPTKGAKLMLRALKTNEFVEIARYIP